MSTRPFFQDQDQDQDLVLQDQDQDQDFEKISRQDQDQDLTLQDQDQDQDLSSQDETKIKTFTADTLMLKSKQYATIQNLRKKYRPISVHIKLTKCHSQYHIVESKQIQPELRRSVQKTSK
jgi:hypothetical protein